MQDGLRTSGPAFILDERQLRENTPQRPEGSLGMFYGPHLPNQDEIRALLLTQDDLSLDFDALRTVVDDVGSEEGMPGRPLVTHGPRLSTYGS